MPDTEAQRKARERIIKLEKLANGTHSKEEASAARDMASKIRKEYGIFGHIREEEPPRGPSSFTCPATSDPGWKPREIFRKKFVVKDLEEEEFNDLLATLESISNQIGAEFNDDGMIVWNAQITIEKHLIFFTTKRITIWMTFSSRSKAILRRMVDLFMSQTGMRKA